MVKSILLIGVGGQGTILISKILAAGLASAGYDVKMSEIHGMSQRGGSVTTQIRYGDKVYAPYFGDGEADIIISFEKSEALRALPALKKGGTIISDDHEVYSVPVLTGAVKYPHDALDLLKQQVPELVIIPAFEIAESLGNTRVQNIVLLGALVNRLDLENVEWRELIAEMVPQKAIEINLRAYEAGRAM